jgi:hypothetical protein
MQRRGHNRKRRILLTLAALAAVAMAATALASGPLGLHTDRAKRSGKRSLRPRYQVVEGVLQRDRIGAWMLDDGTPLRLSKDLVWREELDGRENSPASGRTVRLLGQYYGQVLQVNQATLISPHTVAQRMQEPPVAPPDQEIEDLPK